MLINVVMAVSAVYGNLSEFIFIGLDSINY